jgi:hypothetical protein
LGRDLARDFLGVYTIVYRGGFLVGFWVGFSVGFWTPLFLDGISPDFTAEISPGNKHGNKPHILRGDRLRFIRCILDVWLGGVSHCRPAPPAVHPSTAITSAATSSVASGVQVEQDKQDAC